MRAALVLLFAVGVSSMKISEVVTSHMNETQNHQPLYIQMMDNMMETLNDMKAMVKQRCQETTSAMPEDDSAHLDGVGPRFCHLQLTVKWNVCRKMCKSLPLTQLISCRSTNWFNYLNACIGGKVIMQCSKLAVSDEVVDGMVNTTHGGEIQTKIPSRQPCRASDGFILSPGGDQCFRPILDEGTLSWYASLARCQDMGMTLAEPYSAVAVWLRGILNGKHGDKSYWVGGRGGSDSRYTWQGSSIQVINSNLWLPGAPRGGGSSSYCVLMTAWSSDIHAFPGKLYYDWSCANSFYPLCEQDILE